MPTRKPTTRRFQYGGLSALRADDGRQRLILVGDQGRAGPSCDVRIHDPIQLREALGSLLRIIERGFGYSPSTPEMAALVGDSYESWRDSAPNLTPIQARQGFHAFLAESDPDAWLVMDPVVTIQPNGIVFEVFDKRGRIYAALTLDASAFEGTLTPGTIHVEAGDELLNGLALIHSRSELRLVIGADAAEQLEESHTGELTKSFVYPALWRRQLLQVQASSTLPGRRAPMARVDVFNLLRYLRLHKENKGDPRALRFALIPGESPEMTVEPWEWRYQCVGPKYEGDQSEIIGIWDRREPMAMERMLPYIERAQVQLLGEAQPTFWSIDCGTFAFTMATPGFRAANWSRGLMMDIHLPRHTPNPAGYDALLSALDENGVMTLDALGGACGLSGHDLSVVVRRACQNGEVFFDPGSQMLWRRPLFAGGIDVDQLRFREAQEGKAWRLVEQGRVNKQFSMRPTGEIDFVGAPDADYPTGRPSEVTEPKHPFQEREPRFTPKLEINRAGATRKPGCTCTYWKRQTASTKAPCAHIQALWLRHCMDVEEEKRLEESDPTRIKIRNGTFVKRRSTDEEVHEIALRFQRVTEVWGTRQQLRDARGRRQVLVFPSVDDAREAFFARCAELEQKGFLNASK
ncbi:MAG: hypothetical protein AAFV53_38035 [Myxococcota bacterium]